MENHLKLFLPFSLKELLLRKVAVLFCSDSDVLKLFNKPLFSRLPICYIKEWLEATTEEKMLELGLPESLNKQVIDRIRDMGFKIREWIEDNKCSWIRPWAEIKLRDLLELCWTSTGAIDLRKLAEQCVLCDGLRDWQRYEIACRHCLENHIPLLWHNLSEADKNEYEIYQTEKLLEFCWAYILKGEQSKLDDLWRGSDRNLTSFNQWVFEDSARCGNQVATEYFFQELTPEERGASLMRTARRVTGGNVLFYLLSLMSPEQQMELVKDRPVEVLLCFLDSHRRHLLPENAGLVWAHLPQSEYSNLLERIRAVFIHRDNCFSEFLKEFFKHAPLDFIKNSFLGHELDYSPPACFVLCALIDYEDWESIEVMFRHADESSRVKLLLCRKVFHRFHDCISKEKWRGVEVCFREAALSEEDRDALKESFRRFLYQRLECRFLDQRPVFQRIFRRFSDLLDETDGKEKKAKGLSSNSATLGNKLFLRP